MTDLQLVLPPHDFERKDITIGWWRPHWVEPIFAEAERVCAKPGWNPKTVQLGDGLLMISLWMMSAKLRIPAGITVVRYVDHPFLSQLPANAPRALRSLYTKEVRLRHARALDIWDRAEMVRNAKDAWAKYLIGGDGVEKAEAFLDRHPGCAVIWNVDGSMEIASAGAVRAAA